MLATTIENCLLFYPEGRALFPLVSVLSHSCYANLGNIHTSKRTYRQWFKTHTNPNHMNKQLFSTDYFVRPSVCPYFCMHNVSIYDMSVSSLSAFRFSEQLFKHYLIIPANIALKHTVVTEDISLNFFCIFVCIVSVFTIWQLACWAPIAPRSNCLNTRR